MKLRTLLLCIAAAIALTLCASAANIVDSGTCGDNGDNVTWTLDSDGVLTISGAGTMDDWNLSNHSPWYGKRQDIVTAIIRNGVANIGNFAFCGCTELTSVTIPDSVTSIGRDAFDSCKGLTSVSIPASVANIGESPFWGCATLTSIDVNSESQNYMSESGVLFNKNQTTLICYPSGKIGAYEIPDSVTAISQCAFFHCEGLTNITIPDSVNSILNSAFTGCVALTSVIIPDSVTTIGSAIFAGCKNLLSVKISDSVTVIKDYTFNNCTGMTSVIIPDSVIYIGLDAFNHCAALTDIYYAGSSAQWSEISVGYQNQALQRAAIHYNAQDIGIGIELTDESGNAIDPTKDVLGDNDELTASFTAADPDAVKSSELVTANVFLIFYDKDGLMVSLESKEIDLSDPFSLMFVLELRIPTGAKTLKFLILSDSFEPLRVARMIESSAA